MHSHSHDTSTQTLPTKLAHDVKTRLTSQGITDQTQNVTWALNTLLTDPLVTTWRLHSYKDKIFNHAKALTPFNGLSMFKTPSTEAQPGLNKLHVSLRRRRREEESHSGNLEGCNFYPACFTLAQPSITLRINDEQPQKLTSLKCLVPRLAIAQL